MTRINIDDDMIERFIGAGGCYQRGKTVHESVRMGLQAALDRRTGPKDRRVEQDDTCSWSRRMSNFGRRDDDKCWVDLPHKSERLKREAEEREKQKAQEIYLSEEMLFAADLLRAECRHKGLDNPSDTQIYRAMRLQEMKERGQ